jgi:diguanylate cyclase (GGDEF)-like protein
MIVDERAPVLIPDAELGFPEGTTPAQALLSILETASRLLRARSATLLLPADRSLAFGADRDFKEGRLELSQGIIVDTDEARAQEVSRRCVSGQPLLIDEGAALLLPNALGALLLEAPDLRPETAPLKLPLAQALAAFAASTASWASQVAQAEARAEAEQRAHRELRLECAQLRELSEIDELTGLRNRRFFTHHLDHEVSRYRRYGHPLTLALIDLDHFKQVNDRYGHAVGDAALRYVAERALETMRESDVVARIGGDELAVLMPDTPLTGGARAAERLRTAMESTPFEVDGSRIDVTLSIGVAGIEETGLGEPAAFFKAADEALYLAKERGRNQISVMRDSRIPAVLDELTPRP